MNKPRIEVINKAIRFAKALEEIIHEKATKDVHYTGTQKEPEISKDYVRQEVYEALVECEQLDDLFDEIAFNGCEKAVFEQVKYEKLVAWQEQRDVERFERSLKSSAISSFKKSYAN